MLVKPGDFSDFTLNQANVSRLGSTGIAGPAADMYYDMLLALKAMARPSSTRSLVRKYAQQIHDQGGTPTLAMLKRMLGNKGSPNTVLDELRKWQQERVANDAASPALTAGAPPPAAHSAAQLPVPAELAALAKQLHEASAMLRAAEELPSLVHSLCSQFAGFTERLTADRELVEKALELMNLRFEAVQRRALLQIDEARGEATRWREKHQHMESEFGTWKETNRQRTQRLLDENAWLRGKLGMPVGSEAPARASQGPTYAEPGAARRPAVYPGHPRAIDVSDE